MTAPKDPMSQYSDIGSQLESAREEIQKRFIGQRQVVTQVITALLSGGHALLVGVPGLGKTLLVDTVGQVMGLQRNRVQFTPDLMPADILGSEVLEASDDGTRSFRFVQGPIFCSLLMADEINRASPRTQAALLQAMQERAVTIAGHTYELGAPYHVLATQNPIEQEGTYPLPEAQLDRFLMQIDIGYPDHDTEREILLATTGVSEVSLEAVFTKEKLQLAQTLVRKMPVGEELLGQILALVRACRPEDASASEDVKRFVEWGPGPRAAQALMLATRAHALLDGRIVPGREDLRALAKPVLGHRMSLKYTARAEGITLRDVIDQALDASQDMSRAA